MHNNPFDERPYSNVISIFPYFYQKRNPILKRLASEEPSHPLMLNHWESIDNLYLFAKMFILKLIHIQVQVIILQKLIIHITVARHLGQVVLEVAKKTVYGIFLQFKHLEM